MRIKLRQEMHQSWVGMKRLLEAKSDNALARHLFTQFTKTQARTVTNRNATKANHASSSICSSSVVTEGQRISETTMG